MSSIAMRPPLRLLKATSKTTWRDKTGHQERKKEDEIQLSLKTGLFFFFFYNLHRQAWHINTDLHGVWCLQVHLDRYPATQRPAPVALVLGSRPPQLLVLTHAVAGEDGEDVPSLLTPLVLKTQASRQGDGRHGRHQRGHFFKSLRMDGVHVHQVT